MNNYIRISILFSFTLITNMTIASSLSFEAEERGINSICSAYLTQLEESYDLNGLNLTFAYPSDPSNYPSLHTSAKKYNNGSSFFAATLSPEQEYCYVSTISVTVVHNQNCNEISQLKVEEDPTIQVTVYADGDYILLNPKNNNYQLVLINSSESSCTLTESRMMFPGK